MIKILSIISKNLKLILRSKTSALIMVFGPLLIMLVVGVAFNNKATLSVNVGYHSPEYNDLTLSFVDVLNSSGYTITRFDTVPECADAIGSGNIHICIDFPPDFEISNDKVNNIIFLVDNSKINLFEAVVDSIENGFNKKARELSTGLTQDILNKLNATQSTLADKAQIIQLMKNESKDEKKDLASIYSSVSGLDLNFDSDAMGTDELSKAASTLLTDYSQLMILADDAVDEGIDLVKDMEDEFDDTNMTSIQKKPFLDMLNKSHEDLLEFRDELDVMTSDANTTSILRARITQIKQNLQGVEQKFAGTAQARDNSLEGIKSLEAKLDRTYERVLSVEATFNAISQNIAATQVTDVQTIVQPITKEIQPVFTDQSQLNFYFPYLMMLIIMFIGILISSTLVIMEKTSMAYFRNFVTPTRDFTFILGTYFTTFIIMAIQLIILTSIFALYFGRDIVTNLGTTIIVLLMSFTMFTFIGMIIGYLFSTEETGTLASISIGSIFLFISDLIFPLERMPPYVADLAREYNPFVLFSDLLRRSMVHNVELYRLADKIYILLLYLLVMFVFLIIIHKLMKKHFLLRYSGYRARREFRRQARVEAEKRMLELVDKIPEGKSLKKHDGTDIRTYEGLIEYINVIDDDLFLRIMSHDPGYFADWIQNVLKNHDLARKVRKATTRKACLSALGKGKKEYGKMAKRLSKAGLKDTPKSSQ